MKAVEVLVQHSNIVIIHTAVLNDYRYNTGRNQSNLVTCIIFAK